MRRGTKAGMAERGTNGAKGRLGWNAAGEEAAEGRNEDQLVDKTGKRKLKSKRR